jgi:hypothetical protein
MSRREILYSSQTGSRTYVTLSVEDGYEPPDTLEVTYTAQGSGYSARLSREFTWEERLERARKSVAEAAARHDREAAMAYADTLVEAWLEADHTPGVSREAVLGVWKLSRGRDD